MKERYYISVQSQSIMLQQGDAAYEFEIDATEEDIVKLEELFVELNKVDNQNFFRAPIPGIPYHHDEENDGYDYYLNEIYRLIQQLGTTETSKHIASMGIR